MVSSLWSQETRNLVDTNKKIRIWILKLPRAPAAQGKDPGRGNTVVPEPGNVRGFGAPLMPLRDATGLPN